MKGIKKKGSLLIILFLLIGCVSGQEVGDNDNFIFIMIKSLSTTYDMWFGSINPDTKENMLECPDGMPPHVYQIDFTRVLSPALMDDSSEWDDWDYFIEIYAPDGVKDNSLFNSGVYSTCGATGQIIKDSNGLPRLVPIWADVGDRCGYDSFSLYNGFTKDIVYEDEQPTNNMDVFTGYYNLFLSSNQNAYDKSTLTAMEGLNEKTWRVLMCNNGGTHTGRVYKTYNTFNPRPEFLGSREVAQFQIPTSDNDRAIILFNREDTGADVLPTDIFGSSLRPLEGWKDGLIVAGLFIMPRLPSSNIIYTGLSGATYGLYDATFGLNPKALWGAVLSLVGYFILYIMVFIFHMVKTYLILSTIFLAWTTALEGHLQTQSRIIGIDEGLKGSLFLMIIGSIIIVALDWSQWVVL